MGRLRGWLWMIAGLIVASLAALVGFVALSGASTGGEAAVDIGPQVSVVIASRSIPLHSLITESDVQVVDVSMDQVPEGAVASLDDVVGKASYVDIFAGEIVLDQRLYDPNVTINDGRVAIALEEDKVLMALPARDLMSQAAVLKPGDQVDLLFTLFVPVPSIEGASGAGYAGDYPEDEVSRDDEKQTTFDGLQNGKISAIVAAGLEDDPYAEPQSFLVAVSPQDALVLKYVLDADGIMDIVMRAPGQDQPFEVDPVDMDYIIDRYQLPVEPER